MDTTPDYQIKDLVIRQAPLLSAGGQLQTTTTVSFTVGPHGPFTLVWPGVSPSASDIATAINAKVQDIRAIATAVSALNARA